MGRKLFVLHHDKTPNFLRRCGDHSAGQAGIRPCLATVVALRMPGLLQGSVSTTDFST